MDGESTDAGKFGQLPNRTGDANISVVDWKIA